MFARNSKFRHVFGFPAKKDLCYEGFRVARTAHEPSPCAVNPLFAAMAVESSGGGAFIVIPLKKKGRVATDHPRVRGHSAPITDLKWNPFDPWIIASSSEDCTVKLWRLPFDGLRLDLSRCLVDLRGHTKKVTHIEWHPTARDILLSASTDLQCILWNSVSADVLHSIKLHPDIILSVSWNRTGSLFASTCRDRRIRIIDPRQGTVVAEGEGHEGLKASRVVFLNNRNWIFTTGFSRGSQRQMALWDAGDLSRPIRVEDVDSSSGILIPFFDPDTSIMYLAGKGDGNIRFYEIVSRPPHIVYLGQFLSNSPQCGLGMMPKWGVDPYKCELVRFYKLHSTKDLCEPVSMIAPRKSERFQEDIFPATSSPEPALKVEEWLQGHNDEPKKISMKDIGDTLLNFFKGGSHSQQRNSDDEPTKANNALKTDVDDDDTYRSEEQLNGDHHGHHQPHHNIIEDGRKYTEEEDAECFQKGMVRLNIGKFEDQKQQLNHHGLPPPPSSSSSSSATEIGQLLLLLRSPPLPMTTTTTTSSSDETGATAVGAAGIKKTSSFQFNVSFPNGITSAQDGVQPVKVNEPDVDSADGSTSAASVRLRQMSSSSSPLSSSSSSDRHHHHHRVVLPQKDFHFHGTTVQQNENEDKSRGNGSQDNGTVKPVAIETPTKELDLQSTTTTAAAAAFRSHAQINIPPPSNDFRGTGSRISRSRSELLPASYRYPFWTSKSSTVGPEVEADAEDEAGMLDFISTEAPDDRLVKPSVLRSSMLTRRRERGGPGKTPTTSNTTTSSSLRRTASLRESSTRTHEMRQENDRSPSSGFKDGKPVQNVWGSSTNGGDAPDKKILKMTEGRGVWKSEDVERKSTPRAFRNSAYEHRFQSSLPLFHEGGDVARRSSGSGFIPGTSAAADLNQTAGIYHGAVSGTSTTNSAPYNIRGSSRETVVPETAQGTATGTMDQRDSVMFRSASMERWKRHYERLVEGKGGLGEGGGRGKEGGGVGVGGGGGRRGGAGEGASNEHVDPPVTPKSQENVVMTKLVVMLTPHEGKIVPTLSVGKDATQSKSLSGGSDVEDDEEKMADENGGVRKKTMWNGKERRETETDSVFQRQGWSDEDLPSDYDELLSEFVQQRQLIQHLRDDVQTRDRMIQRLEKQLGLLLRQTISLPAFSNYG